MNGHSEEYQLAVEAAHENAEAGSPFVEDVSDGPEPCESCKGYGEVLWHASSICRDSKDCMARHHWARCETCHGTGQQGPR